MHTIYPTPLKSGDTIMVIAPSSPSTYIREHVHKIAIDRFKSLGINVVFAPNFAYQSDIETPASIAARVADIHVAFSDKNIKGIFTVLGGYHSNQLLNHINFDLIRQNPKVFCGFSDITALTNAILAQTGLITFCGPHYSSFGMLHGFDFTMESFQNAIMGTSDFEIRSSSKWSDDPWYRDQESRTFIPNAGPQVMQNGFGHGHLIGGNLSTFALLQGTKYMPSDFEDIILFVEDDGESSEDVTIRQLNGIFAQGFASKIRGVLEGRFQREHNVNIDRIYQSIKNALPNVPVIMDLDFGHTTPLLTIPTGAMCNISANGNEFKIKVYHH